MEEIKPPFLKAAVGYGIMISVVIIIYALILFIADLDMERGLNWVSYLILLVGIYLVSVSFRNKYMDGFITYGQAWKVGFLSSLFVGLVMMIWTFVYFSYLNPGAIQEIIAMSEESLVERGMSDIEIDQAMPMIEAFNNVTVYMIFALIGNIVIGAILSLITSIFVKREHPEMIDS